MELLGGVKRMLKNWLEISDAQNIPSHIYAQYDFETNCAKNTIWMRGDSYELEQFYKNNPNMNASFWASVPYVKMRKIHMGIPEMSVNALTDIIISDFNGVLLDKKQNEFDDILSLQKLSKLLKRALSKTLSLGDGCFRISFDKKLSDKPIVEFIAGDRVDIVYNRGMFEKAVFKTVYVHKHKKYMLHEIYGYGYIKYKLYDMVSEKEVPIDRVPETAGLVEYGFAGYTEDNEGNMLTPGTFNMAIPFMIFESVKFENRGKSIFDGREERYDALDEVFSQWMDAIRAGRTTKYIPESLLPRDKNGYVINPNDFDNRFIKADNDMSENAKNEITVVQPSIPSESYIQAYITALDSCLQGIISPSTLGIDTKKLDNAEAQREKEKTTLYTRGKIIDALSNTLPEVVNSILKSYLTFNGSSISDEDVNVTVNFGEYANPSFEAVVETVSKAREKGIMSLESSIDELYGDSKDEKWKQEEVRRLKEEQGIAEVNEPEINMIGDVN